MVKDVAKTFTRKGVKDNVSVLSADPIVLEEVALEITEVVRKVLELCFSSHVVVKPSPDWKFCPKSKSSVSVEVLLLVVPVRALTTVHSFTQSNLAAAGLESVTSHATFSVNC